MQADLTLKNEAAEMGHRSDPTPSAIVLFKLADLHYGLALSAVERVVRVVEVTPLPKAPEIVIGVVNVAGTVIPVINMRRRFRLWERDIVLSDQLVIAHTTRRTVALLVDSVIGVLAYLEQRAVPAQDVLPDLTYVESIVKLGDGLVFIHNLDTFLSLDEEARLDQAVQH